MDPSGDRIINCIWTSLIFVILGKTIYILNDAYSFNITIMTKLFVINCIEQKLRF